MERAFQTRSSVKEVLGSFRRGTFSSLTPVELNFNVAENFDVCFIKANVACDVFVGGDLRAAGMPRPHKALRRARKTFSTSPFERDQEICGARTIKTI